MELQSFSPYENLRLLISISKSVEIKDCKFPDHNEVMKSWFQVLIKTWGCCLLKAFVQNLAVDSVEISDHLILRTSCYSVRYVDNFVDNHKGWGPLSYSM